MLSKLGIISQAFSGVDGLPWGILRTVKHGRDGTMVVPVAVANWGYGVTGSTKVVVSCGEESIDATIGFASTRRGEFTDVTIGFASTRLGECTDVSIGVASSMRGGTTGDTIGTITSCGGGRTSAVTNSGGDTWGR